MTTRRFTIEARPESVREARMVVRETLRYCGITDTDLAELATSELVSNAIEHGEEPVSVVVRCAGGMGRVEVHDASPDLPRRWQGGEGRAGTGLVIVDAFTPSWGVEPTPAGKAVWFQVATGPGGSLGT
ncbi:MAG TPA: ATP-binding protein [Aquihabitans sp.]|nr:ATP-binding protein [Aquihabitans sp.]